MFGKSFQKSSKPAPSSQDGITILDTISIPTSDASSKTEKRINLCAGDLSKIPVSWNVDLLLISAFRNDYTATPGSVIGALANVGVNVRLLAKKENKAEDLRNNYQCWYSKPCFEVLKTKTPFKRLICFENSSINPARDVGTVFRGLSTLNVLGTELKVVSSLLKTGDSGHDMGVMLEAMITSCANWMVIGMPIQEFNIVLYHKGTGKPAGERYAALFGIFSKYKDQVTSWVQEQSRKSMNTNYDLYLSYSPKEESFADNFKSVMASHASSLRVHAKHELLQEDSSWQKEMYDNINSSHKVVHFLSQPFLSTAECIEQFNISYYLNSHDSSRMLMAPLLLDGAAGLPNYMKSIQWINCDSYDMDKITVASKQIYDSLIATNKLPLELKTNNSKIEVFISYAHKDTELMKDLRQSFTTLRPEINLFVDTDKLATGHSWQQTLYESIESSKFVVCLLSEDYFSSAVCREEFHLALASALKNSAKIVVPVCITSDFKPPKEYPLNVIDLKSNVCPKFSVLAAEIVDVLNYKKYLKTTFINESQSFKKPHNLQARLLHKRDDFFDSFVTANLSDIESSFLKKRIDNTVKKVAIIHHVDDIAISEKIKVLLKKMSNSAIEIVSQSDVGDTEFAPVIDASTTIIAVVSTNFASDQQCLSNFNLALLDCRMTSDKRTLVLQIDDFHQVVYPSLVCNKFALPDAVWKKTKLFEDKNLPEVSTAQDKCITVLCFVLLTRAHVKTVLPDNRSCMFINPL